MDDIAIHMKKQADETKKQHMKRHQAYMYHILNKLEENNLYIKPEKYKFKKEEIKYLEVIIGRNKLQIDPKKLKGVTDWPKPKNLIDIQKFLGFIEYYCYFVPDY
jgi:hypothetical protein